MARAVAKKIKRNILDIDYSNDMCFHFVNVDFTFQNEPGYITNVHSSSKNEVRDKNACSLEFEFNMGDGICSLSAILLSSNVDDEFTIYLDTYLVDSEGFHRVSSTMRYDHLKPISKRSIFVCYLVPERTASMFVRNGKITFHCRVIIVSGKFSKLYRNSQTLTHYENNADFFSCQMEAMFESKKHTDVTLKVGDNELKAHKSVLCVRSSVFAEILDKTPEENSLDITDVEFPILEIMVRYLYSDKIEKMCPDITPALYEAACKYKIFGLRYKCSDFMACNLDLDNMYSVLCLADKYNDKTLNLMVKMFIKDNRELVLEDNRWESLKNNNPKLAEEALKY